MQKLSNKNKKILLKTEEELFNQIVEKDHPFRKLQNIINFDELSEPLRSLYSDMGRIGIDIEKGLKILLMQFWEDYSDRTMEKALKENMAIRWFCGFGITEVTPDHSYFGRLRERLGAKNIANVFNEVNSILNTHGLFGNVFKFIDASAIVTKTALWEERDKAIKDGEEKLNNAVVNKYTADKDAKWGAKGKNKIWFGYKQHCSVDMRYGLISKLCVTPANVLDYKVLKNICPINQMIFADKLYDVKNSYNILKSNNCNSGIIMKNNNKDKDKDFDKWKSKIRMPFEGTFSKLSKRTRYRGQTKVLFQCFSEAICLNLKKAIKILPEQAGA